MHLKAPRAQDRLVDHVFAVCHANDQDVVQRLHAVDLGQQLVHNRIVDTSIVARCTAGLANGVELVKNNDVEHGVLLLSLLLPLCFFKQLSDLLLRATNELVENLWPVDNLRLAGVQDLADLPGDERFSTARGAVEEHAPDVLNPHGLDQGIRVEPGCEGPSKNLGELGVQATNAQFVKVELLVEDLLGRVIPSRDVNPSTVCLARVKVTGLPVDSSARRPAFAIECAADVHAGDRYHQVLLHLDIELLAFGEDLAHQVLVELFLEPVVGHVQDRAVRDLLV
mmetsp:Transcript_23016/g.66982  ORF Transcript_23016/g.66982 Transcript_23016/m.66982 type:complete len:282 (+) Transcript_23016:1071-1916(+)